MLLVIEGLDGAGKSTQVRMLREYISSVSAQPEYIHFPRYDAPVYGELIGTFLKGGFGDISSVHPRLVALLYAEDRHGAAPLLRQALSEGKCLILDRYVYSNVAYQCAKFRSYNERERLREWILNTEFGAFDLPRPDLNIFLDVPIALVEQRLATARKGADRSYLGGRQDIHEADIDFQRRVREVYLRQCEVDPGFVRVDCAGEDGSALPPDKVFEKVKAILGKVI